MTTAQRLSPHSSARWRYHWPLAGLIIFYGLLAGLHSLIVPLTVGNDEWAHFQYLRFIAEQHKLPTSWPERELAGYKSDAPPLYHLLVAGLTAPVEPTRLLRPLDSPRRHLADNIIDSPAIVQTAVHQPPYRGELLLWHLGRGVSILFGMTLIGLTYLTSWYLTESRAEALTAAGIVAFWPTFVFYSSVLTYETLSAMLTALFLLTAIQIVKTPTSWLLWLILGGLAGLAITAKYSALLLPLEIVLLAWLVYRAKGMVVKRTFVAGLMMGLTVSWWFGFILWHFNTIPTDGFLAGTIQPIFVGDASDTTSVQVATFLFNQETGSLPPPRPRHYPQLFSQAVNSFWTAPVRGQFPGAPIVPLGFTLLIGLAVVGLIRLWQQQPQQRIWLVILSLHSLLIVPLLLLRVGLSFDPVEAVQGRHLFMPAASAIALLLVWGWRYWQRYLPILGVGLLLIWTLVGQIGLAYYRYPPPIPVWPANTLPTPPPPQIEATLLNALRLHRVDWTPTANQLKVTLWWHSLTTMLTDYVIELRLIDSADRIVGYGAGHPAGGRYPTRAWEPGDWIEDQQTVYLIDHLNGTYRLQLQLVDRQGNSYLTNPLELGPVSLSASPLEPGCPTEPLGSFRDRATFAVNSSMPPRLQAFDQTVKPPWQSVGPLHLFMVEPDWYATYELWLGETACGLVQFDLPARSFVPPTIPTPLMANFNDEVELLGYDLPTRHINPGERLPLTLYWRSLGYLGYDYLIFDNLLDANQQRWGGYDRRPQDGYSTLLWAPGEVITDAFGIPVDPNAPAGIYTIDVGLYRKNNQLAETLPLMQDGQPSQQHSIRLGPIKVGDPVIAGVGQPATPEIMLNQAFNDSVKLLGYDLVQDCPRCPLTVTLYWQATNRPAANYTTFLHVRNGDNQVAVQHDEPPAGHYPTSLWETGEISRQTITLPMTDLPAGSYRLVVGLYNSVTGDRLPLADNEANERPLTEVIIP